MATFYSLLGQRNQPVEAIFAATDVAEENRVLEAEAAIKIQSVARMRRQFLRYRYVRRCIIDIQRIYRGYRGRILAVKFQISVEKLRRRRILDYFAARIQAAFRGFYSRKWISDFYAQKRYLVQVYAKSEAIRSEAQDQNLRQQAERNDTLRTATLEEYQKATANMHHLLSTAARSGVLRPAMALKGLTTVFSTNIEEDIRKVPIPRRKFKADLPQSTCTINVKGGSRVPAIAIGGPSLHAQTPYDAMHEQSLLESRVNKKLTEVIHQTDFVTRKPDPPKFPKTLASDSEFQDQYTIRRQTARR